MKRKKIVHIAGFSMVAVAILLAGCAQFSWKPEPEPAAEVTESGNAETKSEPAPAEVTESGDAAALQCGNTLLKAFQENRYELLKEVLAENLQKEFSSEAFSQTLAQLQRTLGTLRSFEYLGELKTPQLKTLVWKLCFSRKSSEGGDIEQETLFKVLIAPIDGKSRVISFNFL